MVQLRAGRLADGSSSEPTAHVFHDMSFPFRRRKGHPARRWKGHSARHRKGHPARHRKGHPAILSATPMPAEHLLGPRR
eukprot:174589-Chlamydomonas_euryale.AAC.2